MTRWWRWWW